MVLTTCVIPAVRDYGYICIYIMQIESGIPCPSSILCLQWLLQHQTYKFSNITPNGQKCNALVVATNTSNLDRLAFLTVWQSGEQTSLFMRSHIFTAVNIKITVLWDVTMCCLLQSCRLTCNEDRGSSFHVDNRYQFTRLNGITS
jgi:hypothetical protein